MMSNLGEPIAFIILITEDEPALQIPIKGKSFSIGRVADNDLCLADNQSASRYHCVIKVSENNLILEDLNSSNGTYLNGVRIEGIVPVILPSLLVVGRSRLALIPPLADVKDLSTLIESTYSSRGSIVVPSSSSLKERESAFMVVDLVGSTRMLQQDDIHLAKIVAVLGRLLERELRREPEPFLQCTGDGFFASFGRAEAAMGVAVDLEAKLAQYFSRPVQICIALHWGSSYLTGEGSRTGKDVYAVFGLEGLRKEDKAIGEPLGSQKVNALYLMTEVFLSKLSPEHQANAKPLGSYKLKGLDTETQVFLWQA
jgi:class 3 adenylate cyclase